ncbi:MAG TPA: hypothetical protein VMT86_16435, partial [Bryobacteraceae bacterium]|nr:hypothetical protein [Bryobacteraceae bacterium]
QLIDRGLRPYIDFCFPQTPLNTYWNAGWFRVFGDTWRTAHAVGAVMISLATLLTGLYAWRRFPAANWRTAAGVSSVLLTGLNVVVFEFGTIGQAYGLCLFLVVAAFLCAITAAGRTELAFAAGAGLLACTAANASLLTAPVAPVLLIWMIVCSRAGNRWTKAAAFVACGVIPFWPLGWLFLQGPRQTIFNVLQYHMLYRQVQWEGAWQHNIDEWTAWLGSPQALMLGLLAIAGLACVWKHSAWERAARREFYLCGWLSAALILHISTAVPTFTRYYLLAVPFLAILACAGIYWSGSRLAAPDRPFWPAMLVCVLACLCLGKVLFDAHDSTNWHDIQEVAAKVNQVAQPKDVVFADELVYFASRHAPPSGMELADSHKLSFPAATAALFHVISGAELEKKMRAGVYDVIEISDDDIRIDKLGLRQLYAHSAEVGDYDIFWGRRNPSQTSTASKVK